MTADRTIYDIAATVTRWVQEGLPSHSMVRKDFGWLDEGAPGGVLRQISVQADGGGVPERVQVMLQPGTSVRGLVDALYSMTGLVFERDPLAIPGGEVGCELGQINGVEVRAWFERSTEEVAILEVTEQCIFKPTAPPSTPEPYTGDIGELLGVDANGGQKGNLSWG